MNVSELSHDVAHLRLSIFLFVSSYILLYTTKQKMSTTTHLSLLRPIETKSKHVTGKKAAPKNHTPEPLSFDVGTWETTTIR